MRDAYSLQVTGAENAGHGNHPADSRNTRAARGRLRDSREIIDATRGAVVVEFGKPWAEHNPLIEPLLTPLFARHPDVHHVKIEDGNGRRVGRLFNVKLWPTLIFLYDGKEIMRLVRPNNIDDIEKAFAAVVKQAPVGKAH